MYKGYPPPLYNEFLNPSSPIGAIMRPIICCPPWTYDAKVEGPKDALFSDKTRISQAIMMA